MHKEFAIGKLTEESFAKLFTNTKPSTKSEDINEHWDLKIETKIDVKGIKKQSRGDDNTSEIFHWVELKNVLGKLSWLYGEADYFAFETEEYWIIVDKKKLQKFIEGKCKGKTVGKSRDPYEMYRREGRKDVVVKVKTIDLMFIATQIIEKKNEIGSKK